MISSKKLKLLFISNPFGNFTKICELYNKISAKSGQFNLMIITGEVFSQMESFSSLNSLSSLQCKIIIFDSSSISSVLKAKLNYEPYLYSSNITILGRSGIYEYDSLKIGYLNGYENTNFLNKEKVLYSGDSYTYYDIEHILNNNNDKIDILLLSSMPQVIAHEAENDFSSPFHNEEIKISTKQILHKKISFTANILIRKFNPRYIITSVDDFYYERKPFITKHGYLSRYINLSFLNNKTNLKEKFIYAINTSPIISMDQKVIEAIDNLTSTKYSLSPFDDPSLPNSVEEIVSHVEKFNLENIKVIKDELYLCNLDRYLSYEELMDFLSQFGNVISLDMVYRNKRFTGCASVKYSDIKVHNDLLKKNNYYVLKGRKVGIREKIEKIPSVNEIAKTCWFCYTNPKIEKDLILKTYNNFYLAYPKGPINKMHFLLLPKKHIQSYTELDISMKKEYQEILSSVINFISLNNLSYFIYEKNLPYDNISARHMCINILGVEREVMFSYNENAKDFLEKKKLNAIETYNTNYLDNIEKGEFYYYINGSIGIKISKEEKRLIYYIKVKEKEGDFVDYGRWLICYLIEKEDRLNWKKCEIDVNFLNKLKEKLNKYYIE